MIYRNEKLLCLIILFFTDSHFALAQNEMSQWFFKNRFQCGLDYDTNVEETRTNHSSDGLLKLIWNSQTKYTNQTFFVNLQYHGGFQYYFQTSSEHKTAHDLSGAFIYQLLPRMRFGIRLWGRLKYFNQHDWHYYLKSSELFFVVNVLKFQLTPAYENERLNYLKYNRFNFDTHHFYLSLLKQISQTFSVQLKSGYRIIDFQRYALSHDSQLNDIRYLNYRQNDDNTYFSIQGSFQKKVLSSLTYQYQRNSSNSYGFSFQEHRVTLSLISPISKTFFVRLYGGVERKRYDEALNKIIVTEFDSEREISNFLIVDFSADISSYMSLLFRWSWYNNESPVPGRYYAKSLASISLEYRF